MRTRLRLPTVLLSLVALALAVSRAAADVDVEVPEHGRVQGTIVAGTETEAFRFRAPAGAVVTFRARATRRGPSLAATLSGPSGAVAPDTATTGRTAVVRTSIAQTGDHRIELTADAAAPGGGYLATLRFTAPTSFPIDDVTPAGGEHVVATFSAEAGATLAAEVLPKKDSAARPVFSSIRQVDGPFVRSLADGAVGDGDRVSGVLLPATADYELLVVDGPGGAVEGLLRVRRPKRRALRIDVRDRRFAPGAAVYGRVLGVSGGRVEPGAALGGALAGVAEDVPAGAVRRPTAFLVGTTAPIAPATGDLDPAGPAIAFEPAGRRRLRAPPTIVLPFTGDPSALTILARDSRGRVTTFGAPASVDGGSMTCSFTTSVLAAFAVFRQTQL